MVVRLTEIPLPEIRPISQEPQYSASLCGQIISNARDVNVRRPHGVLTKFMPAKIVAQHRGRVRLRRPDGKMEVKYASRLVAQAWIEPALLDDDEIEFLDGNRQNTAAPNLRVVRRSSMQITLSGRWESVR